MNLGFDPLLVVGFFEEIARKLSALAVRQHPGHDHSAASSGFGGAPPFVDVITSSILLRPGP
jgi:hypothetical protein